MMRHEETEELVDRFLSEPGIEGYDLEFKGKEKLDSTNGKREVIKTLVGMVNNRGGTVIVGVSEDGENPIQSFDPSSEIKRDLRDTARANTVPDIRDKIGFSFDELTTGNRLLRIDVEATNQQYPHKFNTRSEDGWVPMFRDDGLTRQMTPEEGVEFGERHRSPSGRSLTRFEEVTATPRPENTRLFGSPEWRFITRCAEGSQPVFGVELPEYQGPIAYELSCNLTRKSIDHLREIMESAREHLLISETFGSGYSIHQGNRVHCGKGVDRFLDDLEDIQTILKNLLGGHPSDIADEITHLDDYRATVAFAAECYYDLFHLHLYWKNGRVVKGRIGILLRDIPYHDENLDSFFDAIGKGPTRYVQRQSIQKYVLFGNLKLNNVRPLPFEDNDRFVDFIEADNPLYRQHSILQHQFDNPFPRRLLENICSIERMPFRITDATTDIQNNEFGLGKLAILPEAQPWDNLFVDAECEAWRNG